MIPVIDFSKKQILRTLSFPAMILSSTHKLTLISCAFHKLLREMICMLIRSIIHDDAFIHRLFVAHVHNFVL